MTVARILKNWVDQGIANEPNLYLLLEGDQRNAQVPSPITPDQMIEKLTAGNPPKGDVQPFDAAKNPDALQTVFDVAKDNDYVFLFTDGDFRKIRPPADPFNQNALDTSKKAADLFENKPQHPKTFVFLLCTRRIESKNNWFIKKTWKDLGDKQQAIVYGLESPDLHDKIILSDTISKMLSDWLGDWSDRSENGYVSHGWGWLDNGNLSPIVNVTPDLLRLRYGAISFDTGILPMDADSPPTIRVQVDRKAVPKLDTAFPDRIDDFIFPTGQCSSHDLEFDHLAMDDYTFYWWWADAPIFSTEATQPIVFYNNESENYTFNIRVGSSLKDKGGEFLKPIDLNEFSHCLSFYATLDDKKFDLEYQDGKLLLENMSNPFSDESIALPNNNGIVPLIVQGNWSSNQQSLFFVSLLSQSEDTKMVRVRYYPIRSPSPPTPTPGASQEKTIRLQIPLDFFDEKYYPSSIFPQQASWQPLVVFAGTDCPPGLTTPATPPYPTPGGPAPVFDVKTIQVGESGLEITIDMDSTDKLEECKQLILSWDKWPSGIEDYWKAPPKIELTCGFTNNTLVCQ